MKHQKPTYEFHDYSAVENYLRSQNERRELANQAAAKSASAHRLKYVALVITSCGFAALLVLYGVSLLNEEKVREVEKIVEKIVPIERQNNEDPSIRRRLEELEQNEKPLDRPDITTKFNVFKSVPSHIYGFDDVVTGHIYANSKTTYPEKQYCYVQIKSDAIKKAFMNLGEKIGRGSISWKPYTPASSQEISPSQFKSAKNDCQFI